MSNTPDIPAFGKYTVVKKLGEGGFATVYQATDTRLDREVALKLLHPALLGDPTFIQRFEQEAKMVARLEHPRIVTIYDFGQEGGRLFIAMTLARASLADTIRERGRIPWADTRALIHDVCDALDYAHGEGVIHRDLKPANILLDKNGAPLLTDFGFARIAGQSSMSMSINQGIAGTPAYIAPEIWDDGSSTAQSDIYALGCVVYEMLTGQVLFSGQTPMQAMRAHDKGPQFPATWAADVPAGIEGVLSRALAREPAERFPTAGAFSQGLREVQMGPPAEPARPAPPKPAPAPPPRPAQPEREPTPPPARPSSGGQGNRIGLFVGVGVLLLALLSIPFWIGNIGGGDGDTVADAPTEEAMPTEEAAPTEEAMPTEAPTEEASEEMAAEDESAPEAEGDLRELPPVNPATVSGDVYLAGSSVVFPLAQRIAEEFEAEGYTGQLTIDSSGSGAGFERFCVETESDISNASRPIRAEEVQLCVDNGRDPIEYLIGFDAIAVTVSTENDFVEDVTLDELALIFSTAETWADVREEWPAELIQRYSPGTSGTFYYFVEEVFDENQEPLLNASNLQQSENDNVLVSGVESSRYAVGFFGYAYYEEEQDRMQILSINSVEPTIESFEVGKYPLARPLLMYTAGDSIKKPQVAAFLNYTLTHVNDLIRDVGYFPPSDAALNESRQTWLDATGN